MKARLVYSAVLSVIFPVLLLYEALRSANYKYKHWVLTLFITIYGSTIQLYENKDGYRHQEMVYTHYQNLSFTDFSKELANIATFKVNKSRAQDVYKHVLSYFLAVLGLPGLFFTVVAFVYGYFFSGAMLMVFTNFGRSHHSYIFLAFSLLFIFTMNVEGINTVRTWTGMWVLVYACLKYYRSKKIKYLILMLMPPLIHVGYFIMVIPALIVLIFGNWPKVFASIFVLSSVFSFVNPPNAKSQLEQTELGEQKVEGYYTLKQKDTDEVLQEQEERGNRWYYSYRNANIHIWALNLLIYILLLKGIYFKRMTAYQQTLFSIGLAMLTLSNLSWFIFAVSNRSAIIGMIFILASVLITWQELSTRTWLTNGGGMLKGAMTISLIMFIPFFLFKLSSFLDYPSVFLFVNPMLVWFDPTSNMSIKEFIKLFIF